MDGYGWYHHSYNSRKCSTKNSRALWSEIETAVCEITHITHEVVNESSWFYGDGERNISNLARKKAERNALECVFSCCDTRTNEQTNGLVVIHVTRKVNAAIRTTNDNDFLQWNDQRNRINIRQRTKKYSRRCWWRSCHTHHNTLTLTLTITTT